MADPPAIVPAAQSAVATALPAAASTNSVESADADEDEGDDSEPVAEEGESHEEAEAPPGIDGPLYTADISDEVLAQYWKSSPEALGSISFGFVDEGRLMNAEQFPRGEGYTVVSPEKAWATHETIEYVLAAIRKVREQFPNAPPLRVNQLSLREGGFCRPHKSHQNGRDVDLGFFYPTAEPIMVREREKVIDVALNWALVKALVTTGDVQLILVDRRVQKVLYDYALQAGEDKAWLDSLFHGGEGKKPILMHARRHRDHFHVRYFNPRAQELGRRLAPLLAQRPEQNIVMHRVRKGDTLGAIALKYGSSVALLQKVNRLRNSFLRIAQVLKVPLRGPCTHCPVPPPVLVPARRLPPDSTEVKTVAIQPATGGAGQTVAADGTSSGALPFTAPEADDVSEAPRVAAAPAPASAPEPAPNDARVASPAEDGPAATRDLPAPTSPDEHRRLASDAVQLR